MPRLPIDPAAPPRPELSDRQRVALSVIARYYLLHGEAPSAAFVARKLGISRPTMFAHLEALATRGLIISTSMLVPVPRH